MNTSKSPFEYIRDLKGWVGHVKLYKDTRDGTYLAVSRANTLDRGDETMAFSTTKDGKVTSWLELAGRCGATHDELLQEMI